MSSLHAATLAVFGLGRLGSQLAKVAMQRNHRVYGFDSCSLALRKSGCAPGVLRQRKDFDIILLTVKPRSVLPLCRHLEGLPPKARSSTLLLSAAAGVSLRSIEENAPGFGGYARIMPQVTVGTGEGIIPFFSGSGGKDYALEIWRLFGNLALPLKTESQLDDSTVVSGSGPAFFAWTAEMLGQSRAGQGLPAEKRRLLLAHTMISTGHALLREEPLDLIERVASPGGSTAEALQLMNGAPQRVVQQAFDNSRRKVEELRDSSLT